MLFGTVRRNLMLRLLIIALLLCAGPLSATTFTVTNANDSGAGSLRDAIDQAEAVAEAGIVVDGRQLE